MDLESLDFYINHLVDLVHMILKQAGGSHDTITLLCTPHKKPSKVTFLSKDKYPVHRKTQMNVLKI